MAMENYQKAKKLSLITKLGDALLILTLLLLVLNKAEPKDIFYLMAVFLFAVIIIIVNMIAYITEKKSLKEIEDAIKTSKQ
jgi:pilus assembly protein TadC